MPTSGERLKELRAGKGFTQQQMAELLTKVCRYPVSRSTLGMWESGKRVPQRETLEAISDYFGVTIDYLLGRDTPSSAELALSLAAALTTARGIKTPGVKTDAGVIGDLELAVAQADDRTRALIKRILGYSDSQVSAFLLLTQSLPNEQDAPGDPK